MSDRVLDGRAPVRRTPRVEEPLDPELAAALPVLPEFGRLTSAELAAVRAALVKQARSVTLSDQVDRRDLYVPGTPGIRLRVHRPVGSVGRLPCIYWMHGGGFVVGNCEQEDLRFDRWCALLGSMAISVEYRLAPETAYPGAVDDCYAGLRWVHQNAAELGVDEARLGVGGISAGGGLAAALALIARDRDPVNLAFQLLLAPMLDDRMSTPSSGWEVPIWPPVANRWAWDCYLGGIPPREVPALAAPARVDDLGGLPPTMISVGTVDGFFDENVTYASRLTHAGVPTALHVYPGAPHGFEALAPGSRLAREARRTIEEWLRPLLHPVEHR